MNVKEKLINHRIQARKVFCSYISIQTQRRIELAQKHIENSKRRIEMVENR